MPGLYPPTLPGEPLDPLLELRQNPRLLRTVDRRGRSTVRKKLGRLPRVLRDHENDEPRIVTVADAYLQANGSEWNADAIKIFIDQVQQYDALELEELWALASVLKFLLLEEIIMQANAVIKEPESHTEAGAELLKTRMRSLRDIGYADWFTLDRAVGDLRFRPPAGSCQRIPGNGFRQPRVLPQTGGADCTSLRLFRIGSRPGSASPWRWNRGRNTELRIPACALAARTSATTSSTVVFPCLPRGWAFALAWSTACAP